MGSERGAPKSDSFDVTATSLPELCDAEPRTARVRVGLAIAWRSYVHWAEERRLVILLRAPRSPRSCIIIIYLLIPVLRQAHLCRHMETDSMSQDPL